MNRSVTIEPVKLATYERTVIPTSQNKTQQIDEAIVEVVLPIKP